MVWDGKSMRLPAATRLGVVVAFHVAILAWILTSKLLIQSQPPAAISIELVERQTPPAPMPTPEPARPLEPPPEPPDKAVSTAPPPAPVPVVRETPPAAITLEHPTVLTQNEAATEPGAAAPTDAASADPAAPDAAPVTPDQIASVLRQLDCQKLTHRTPESCPYTDAFTAWAARTERATVERNTNWDRTYRSKSTIDEFYDREVRNRLHWPDQDLFADPMAPGAYTAERIRRGQEPLWSQEMRDGFRKPDE